MNGTEFMTTRANEGIDPVLSVWGWQIPVYLFLAGLTAGIMIVASIQEWRFPEKWESRLARTLPLLAMLFLALGMLSLYLDLDIRGLKLNVLRLYMTFRPSSVISWGAWILLIAYPCLALWFFGGLSPSGLARFASKRRVTRFLIPAGEWAVRMRTRLLMLNILVGTCLGAYTGVFLSGMAARPLWHSGTLPPLFLISGISTAAALLGLFSVHHDLARSFIKWDIAALVAESAFLALFLLDQSTGTESHKAAAALFFSGPYSGAFFGLVVFGGILAPLVIGWAHLAKKAKAPLLAPALGLIGGLALRCIIVFAGQGV